MREEYENSGNSSNHDETHEWVASEARARSRSGITDHAQEVLGDIVFLELPRWGSAMAQGAACAVIESVKAASDIYMPVAGWWSPPTTPCANPPQAVQR